MTNEDFDIESVSGGSESQTQDSSTGKTQPEVSKETETPKASEALENVDTQGDESEAEVTDDKSGKEAANAKKKGDGVQARINELTKKRYEAEKQAEYWRQKAEGKNTQTQESKTQPKESTASDGKPNKDNYETLAEYSDAMLEWRFEQKAKAEQADREKAAEYAKQSSMIQSHDARVNEFRETQTDYDEVVQSFIEANPQFQLSQELVDTVIESDLSAQISYNLFKNPAELKRLNGLSGRTLAREVGKLEASVSTPVEPKPKTITKTKAPAPARPVTAGISKSEKSYDDMSFDEFMAARNAKK